MNEKLKNMILAGIFSALIAVGAFIKIPTAFLPITLQVFFVILSGQLLLPKYAFSSVLIYILIGIFGVPVFSQGGGIGYVFNPNFGFLIGFLAGAFLESVVLLQFEKKSFKAYLITAIIAILTIYIIGIPYFVILGKSLYFNGDGIFKFLIGTFAIPIMGDIISAVFASLIAVRVRKVI